MGWREARFLRAHLAQVRHTTMNPDGPGVVRIHLIPPRRTANADVPCAVILNGQDVLPLSVSWAILLCAFIEALNPYDGRVIEPEEYANIVERAVRDVAAVYPREKEATFRGDLWRLLRALEVVARGRQPEEEIPVVSLADYAPHMRAPHRMDLMVSAMAVDGSWHCNQRCVHCYAAGQPLSGARELDAAAWQEIIGNCRTAGIAQLTFTGGEPTMRDDLVELVDGARWFVTRLNTNGVLLTGSLCRALRDASLDSVQITLYAADPRAHDALVGAKNFAKTKRGLENALSAGLNVSVNTPLCSSNADYLSTLRLLRDMGVRYVTCSGLIPAGGANEAASRALRLAPDAIEGILREAFAFCREQGMEIGFTSPGWIEEDRLRAIGFAGAPTCGACLSNMAVTPDGLAVPCQSWLSGPPLGDMRRDPWSKIWDSRACRAIRAQSAKMEGRCPLKEAPR